METILASESESSFSLQLLCKNETDLPSTEIINLDLDLSDHTVQVETDETDNFENNNTSEREFAQANVQLEKNSISDKASTKTDKNNNITSSCGVFNLPAHLMDKNNEIVNDINKNAFKGKLIYIDPYLGRSEIWYLNGPTKLNIGVVNLLPEKNNIVNVNSVNEDVRSTEKSRTQNSKEESEKQFDLKSNNDLREPGSKIEKKYVIKDKQSSTNLANMVYEIKRCSNNGICNVKPEQSNDLKDTKIVKPQINIFTSRDENRFKNSSSSSIPSTNQQYLSFDSDDMGAYHGEQICCFMKLEKKKKPFNVYFEDTWKPVNRFLTIRVPSLHIKMPPMRQRNNKTSKESLSAPNLAKKKAVCDRNSSPFAKVQLPPRMEPRESKLQVFKIKSPSPDIKTKAEVVHSTSSYKKEEQVSQNINKQSDVPDCRTETIKFNVENTPKGVKNNETHKLPSETKLKTESNTHISTEKVTSSVSTDVNLKNEPQNRFIEFIDTKESFDKTSSKSTIDDSKSIEITNSLDNHKNTNEDILSEAPELHCEEKLSNVDFRKHFIAEKILPLLEKSTDEHYESEIDYFLDNVHEWYPAPKENDVYRSMYNAILNENELKSILLVLDREKCNALGKILYKIIDRLYDPDHIAYNGTKSNYNHFKDCTTCKGDIDCEIASWLADSKLFESLTDLKEETLKQKRTVIDMIVNMVAPFLNKRFNAFNKLSLKCKIKDAIESIPISNLLHNSRATILNELAEDLANRLLLIQLRREKRGNKCRQRKQVKSYGLRAKQKIDATNDEMYKEENVYQQPNKIENAFSNLVNHNDNSGSTYESTENKSRDIFTLEPKNKAYSLNNIHERKKKEESNYTVKSKWRSNQNSLFTNIDVLKVEKLTSLSEKVLGAQLMSRTTNSVTQTIESGYKSLEESFPSISFHPVNNRIKCEHKTPNWAKDQPADNWKDETNVKGIARQLTEILNPVLLYKLQYEVIKRIDTLLNEIPEPIPIDLKYQLKGRFTEIIKNIIREESSNSTIYGNENEDNGFNNNSRSNKHAFIKDLISTSFHYNKNVTDILTDSLSEILKTDLDINVLLDIELNKILSHLPLTTARKREFTDSIKNTITYLNKSKVQQCFIDQLNEVIDAVYDIPESMSPKQEDELKTLKEDIVKRLVEYLYNKNDFNAIKECERKVREASKEMLLKINGPTDDFKNFIKTNHLISEVMTVAIPSKATLKDILRYVEVKTMVNKLFKSPKSNRGKRSITNLESRPSCIKKSPSCSIANGTKKVAFTEMDNAFDTRKTDANFEVKPFRMKRNGSPKKRTVQRHGDGKNRRDKLTSSSTITDICTTDFPVQGLEPPSFFPNQGQQWHRYCEPKPAEPVHPSGCCLHFRVPNTVASTTVEPFCLPDSCVVYPPCTLPYQREDQPEATNTPMYHQHWWKDDFCFPDISSYQSIPSNFGIYSSQMTLPSTDINCTLGRRYDNVNYYPHVPSVFKNLNNKK